MGIEIERKFLTKGDEWRQVPGEQMAQGYLNSDKLRTVRVRIAGDKAFLTIKGPSTGATRAEFEYPIPIIDAQQLLALCQGPIIQKIRHRVTYEGFTWEVDEFFGDNAGLVVAEIELASEDQQFLKPDWVGEEVSDDPKYFNSNLAQNPYSTWR
jgi:CYTH domain-containing protein